MPTEVYHRSLRRSLLLAAAIAFGIKITLALATYGTNDILLFEGFLEKARAAGGMALMREGIVLHQEPFTHPPFVLRLLDLWDVLGSGTGLSMRFWMRATGAVADFGSLLILFRLRGAAPHLYAIALSPVALFVTGFHGNTDPILVFFLVLAVWIAQTRGAGWLAGAALGMAMNIKVVALIFVPLLWFSGEDLRRRLSFGAAMAAVFAAGCFPYLWQDPVFVLTHVLGYASQFGFWGIPRMLELLDDVVPAARALTLLYFTLARFVLLAVVVWFSWKRAGSSESLFSRAAFVALLFMTFTPGFGVQHLAWLAPWTAAVRLRPALAFHLAGGVFLFAVYTYWSGGLPWYLANALTRGMWRGPIIGLELAAWATVLWMLHDRYLPRAAGRMPQA